jgi:hypothetical protein
MRLFLWSLTLTLGACGGTKGDTGETGLTLPPASPATGTDTASGVGSDTPTGTRSLSHAVDIQPIWDNQCTPCHILTTSGDLSLVDGYASQVGVASLQLPSMNLIEPGSPEQSYTWRKLMDTHRSAGGAGSIMPLGSGLSPDKMERIETWIIEGAEP